MASAKPEIEALGATVVGVGPKAPFQAAKLANNGYPYPLLLDPDYLLGTAIGVGRQSLAGYLFNLRAWGRWLWAFLTNRRQGKITGHYSNLPGTAIVDAQGQVHWVHRGTGLGDYPPINRILRELEAISSEDE
ncbi:MAG: redoxin domain-containing protein [Acidimicrobiia bacterium]|nr:redoxin domain-containing protein [Acidimicrobiia bacterium]MBT8193844.1 redoxin domain-containing protein [Acidimicrobiia bacterium]MBT8248056.1 redoxin domain-containing protein [Acidimicrobiia bacterium]NNF88640.1 redoxin domain-containing protein [Acidimicrobiia bacterium]NNL12928.1 redoxin domain-containing protein [Acidimicrobiia bacterium]